MQKLRNWKASNAVKKSRGRKLYRRNGVSVVKNKVSVPRKNIQPTPRKHYFSEKQIPTYTMSVTPVKPKDYQEENLKFQSNNLLPIIPQEKYKFKTPTKERKLEKLSMNSPGSPIDHMKGNRRLLQEKLMKSQDNSVRKNLLKDYDIQMRETQKWIDARFEMVIQNPKSNPTKAINQGKSSQRLKVKKSLLKNGWEMKKKIMKNNLIKAQSPSQFISKF